MRPEANAPKKWRTNSQFFLHDNAPAHQSILFKDFLAKNNVTPLEHILSLPGCSRFLSVPRLESVLRKRLSCNATVVNKNGTEEPKGFKMASRNISNTFAVAGRSV
jgi:hypothetical protein